ncbi:MAG: chromosomal replication initiator protein DnaA [candidate division Zixibacteria bacterium]|nr:chromosomal replication initiator protein DnaA [candidate division Zixibacteria bacterium]
MDTVNGQLWKACLGFLEARLGTENLHTWLASTRIHGRENGTVIIAVPNRFVADWIRTRYAALIDEALTAVIGHSCTHRLEVYANGNSPNGNGFRPSAGVVTEVVSHEDSAAEDTDERGHAVADARARAQLNPRFTFDSFVVGQSNQLAHGASLAVAEMPGRTKFNPMCIYGAVGLGKTHLAQAIGNTVLETDPAASVLYVTSERFTNDFIDSLSNRTTSAFASHYRSVDVLLIDDIQFFAGKESTQEQFFHTFNTLHQNGKQIVLTADRAPRDIKGLEERLLSRFQWGLAADIRLPDFETRMAILKKKLEGEDIILPGDVLAHIAQSAHTNIRELEGALVRLFAVSSLNGTPITLEVAQEVLKDTLSPARKPITIGSINGVVARFFGVTEPLLLSKRRTQDVAVARQVAMYLARTLTTMSLKMIGAEYGGRDHSTVIHAVNVVRDSLKLDSDLKLRVDQAISALYATRREAA